jgi:hypothetical protein
MPQQRPPIAPIPGIPAIPAPPRRPVSTAEMTGPFQRPETDAESPFDERPPPPKAPIRPAPRAAPPVSARAVPTAPKPPAPAPQGAPTMRPPAGMTDADVNALYAKYVKAKEMVGEEAGPGAYGKLLKTINAQAPKIMEQYKSKGVDFTVVVKDNQVIIRAKPKG